MIGLLVDLGHRLGYRVWVSQSEQKRKTTHGTVAGLLSVEERYVKPLSIIAGAERAADADVVWYGEGKTPALFEVVWTARLARGVGDASGEWPGDAAVPGGARGAGAPHSSTRWPGCRCGRSG